MPIDLLETYYCKKCDSTDERFQSENKNCLICGGKMELVKFSGRSHGGGHDFRYQDK